MKKVKGLMSFLLVAVLLMSTVFSNSVFANSGISVEIDGQRVNFSDQQPVIVDGRTLVPVRGVFETLGYNISWEQSTNTATLSNGVNTVLVTVGSPVFITNGKVLNLDVPAQIINGRTMLPFRAVLESVGYSVEWDSTRSAVMIFTQSSKPTIAEATAFMVGYWGLIADQSYFQFMPNGEYTFWYFGTLSDELEEYNGSWWVAENTYDEDFPYLLMVSDYTGGSREASALGGLDYSTSGWELINTRYTRVSGLPDIATSQPTSESSSPTTILQAPMKSFSGVQLYPTGREWFSYEVDSFVITDVELRGTMYIVSYELVAKVINNESVNEGFAFALECYDKDGFRVDTVNIMSNARIGEVSKERNRFYCHSTTVSFKIIPYAENGTITPR